MERRTWFCDLNGLFHCSLPLLFALVTGLVLPGCVRGEDKATPQSAKESTVDDDSTNDEIAEEGAVPENPVPGRFPAPSLDGGKSWLNTSGEISLKDLKGKIVLLDFWTFCCINCMHILPDLKYLEHKYSKDLVVIGVHSAKFDNEKDTENIRRAILRYEIEHPVINDANMTVWQKFNVHSWPTLVVIDPEGKYCGHLSGEGNREVLDKLIGAMIKYHRAKGTLDETPVQFGLERNKVKAGALKFPGKILADEAGKRLFISDSNHNRIVIAGVDGNVEAVIGSGAIGKQDGDYATATFDHPQGMALVGDQLYVADTENHLLRQVDLKAKTVTTLAGTGHQSHNRALDGGRLRETALNSPWDLVYVNDKLYIAMAGPHQIWVMDPAKKTIQPYAGSGREDILNGSLGDCALAQPSGIVTDGQFLYVVDSEGSAVRKVPLDHSKKVSTIVGASDLPQGRTLFEFGDVDGIGANARLQHPLGIAIRGENLFVADSYNHKIKQVSLADKSSKTVLGNGSAGNKLSPPQFSEPAGLAFLGDNLYIADTNNHRICVVDTKSKEMKEFVLNGLQPPPATEAAPPAMAGKTIKLPLQKVKGGEALKLEFHLKLPEGFKLNPESPAAVKISAKGDLLAAGDLGTRREAQKDGEILSISTPLAQSMGKSEVNVELTFTYCRNGVGGVCKLGKLQWTFPLEVSAGGKRDQVVLEANLAK
ncbi:MAG: thioredoxin-like domain-containing protein [Planctomycetales bacterium]